MPHRSAVAVRALARWLTAAAVLLAIAAAAPRRVGAQGLGLIVRPQDLVVLRVDADGAGARAGVRAGDQLVALAGQPLRTVDDVRRAAGAGGATTIVVRRGAQRLTQRITLAGGAARAAQGSAAGDEAEADRLLAQAAAEAGLASRGAAPAAPSAAPSAAPPTAPAAPRAGRPAAGGGGLCRPGQRVEYGWSGKWYQAVVIGSRADGYAPCRVHPIGYVSVTTDAWVPLSSLRPTGSGAVEPIPGGPNAYDATLDSIRRGGVPAAPAAAVATGHYGCVVFSGGQLVSSGELTITGPGTYASGSTRGRYTYDAGAGLVRFQGGTWDAQVGDYASRPHPVIHIHGPSGRAVMDCENGGA